MALLGVEGLIIINIYISKSFFLVMTNNFWQLFIHWLLQYFFHLFNKQIKKINSLTKEMQPIEKQVLEVWKLQFLPN